MIKLSNTNKDKTPLIESRRKRGFAGDISIRRWFKPDPRHHNVFWHVPSRFGSLSIHESKVFTALIVKMWV